jgi:hypothetical protein
MPKYAYDRLSAQDNSFLLMERGNVRMHVASTLVCDAGPLRHRDGGIDVDLFKRATESFLHRVPRYRQRLHAIPFFDHAVWVDDPHFDIDYHIRHTALPKPGNSDQLKKLSARIMAQPLDRKRPLWETWVVEGLEGDRFAMITKIHHCMIDGASGRRLSLHPDVDDARRCRELGSRPAVPSAPGAVALRAVALPRLDAADGLPFRDRARLPASSPPTPRISAGARHAREGGREHARHGHVRRRDADERPRRSAPRFDWLQCQLDDLKASARLGLHDQRRRAHDRDRRVPRVPEQPPRRSAQIEFRVSSPVSVRKEEERGTLGQQGVVVDHPAADRARVAARAARRDPRADARAQGVAPGARRRDDDAGGGVDAVGAALARRSRDVGPINTIVTNVPGPQIPLYFHGARVREIYPMVPLMEGMGLGIAVTSYAGTMNFGFNADPDIVPDLASFTAMMRRALERIAADVGVTLSDPAPPAPARRAARKPAAAAPSAAGNGSAVAK